MRAGKIIIGRQYVELNGMLCKRLPGMPQARTLMTITIMITMAQASSPYPLIPTPTCSRMYPGQHRHYRARCERIHSRTRCEIILRGFTGLLYWGSLLLSVTQGAVSIPIKLYSMVLCVMAHHCKSMRDVLWCGTCYCRVAGYGMPRTARSGHRVLRDACQTHRSLCKLCDPFVLGGFRP